MKNIRVFLSENFPFLEVKFSIYLNRRVFVMNNIENVIIQSVHYQHQYHFHGVSASLVN